MSCLWWRDERAEADDRRVSSFGICPEPPVERSEAEGAYGEPLPDAAWSDIVRAFHDHGGRLNAMDGPGVNKNRNDPDQYHAGRKAAESTWLAYTRWRSPWPENMHW